jgi:hypothetical protein
MLAMQNSFMDRNPTLDDPLTVGVIDLHEGNAFHPLAQTLAWNWQQGCMLRWLESSERPTLLYNDLHEHGYVTVMLELGTRESSVLPWAVYDLANHGRYGATLNFERITDTRPGYGYFGRSDPFGHEMAPEEDGIYGVDVEKQARRLLFSLAEALDHGSVRPDVGNKTWFNHIQFNPSGTRFAFLHRWAREAVPGHHGFKTRMFAISPDGSNPVCLVEGIGISHFDWLDDENILVWLWDLPPRPETDHYYLVRDPSGERRIIGEEHFQNDGHCSFGPDRRWMLTDTYPKGKGHQQTLILYDMHENRRIDIGRFEAMQVENDSWRCDLHPRWNRDGTQVCIDSTHEGTRQMYSVDVSAIVK